MLCFGAIDAAVHAPVNPMVGGGRHRAGAVEPQGSLLATAGVVDGREAWALSLRGEDLVAG
jgi:hypothetical protein